MAARQSACHRARCGTAPASCAACSGSPARAVAEFARPIVGGDRHADAARLVRSAPMWSWRVERGLIGGHEISRAGQSGQPHARISGAAEIMVNTALAVHPSLNVTSTEFGSLLVPLQIPQPRVDRFDCLRLGLAEHQNHLSVRLRCRRGCTLTPAFAASRKARERLAARLRRFSRNDADELTERAGVGHLSSLLAAAAPAWRCRVRS